LRHAPGSPAVDFDLYPGTAVFLEESADALEAGTPRWLDLLLGLEIPDPGECGKALWRGRPWATLPPDNAASARGEFGTVPAGGGLLMNLDMDENVWLPALWHRRAGAAADIAEWAAFFRCAPLPAERAPALSPGVRRRIAWTRAFAGHPAGILLEDAAAGAPDADRSLLLDACRRKLADGCAIVWIASSLDPDASGALSPTLPKPTERTP
jgi:ABC-type lipoprotein export system ATPase subunit